MLNKYRIAIYTRSYPPKGGGIAAAHYHLAECLRAQHEVAVFAFDDDETGKEPDVFRATTPKWLARAMQRLARVWVARYASGERATNCEGIFRIAPGVRTLNRRLRAFAPDFIICPDNFLPALALSKPPRAKLLWTAHHNYRRFEGNPVACHYTWIDLQLAHRLERRALRKADAIVAVSEYMRKVTDQTLEPMQPVTVIRNIVGGNLIGKLPTSDLRLKLGLTDGIPLIYLPSAGSAVKGERYAYELIRRLGRSGRAAFFLSGNLSDQLLFELRHLGSAYRFHAPGEQRYENNLSDVAACDITVSPALIENLSSALIESLALGVPVVAFDVGANQEIVQPGVNGSLTPYLDIESMVFATQKLLDNPEMLARLQQNAQLSIKDLLSADRVLSQYNRLFASLKSNS